MGRTRSRVLVASVIAGLLAAVLLVAIGDRSTVSLALAGVVGFAFGAGIYVGGGRRRV